MDERDLFPVVDDTKKAKKQGSGSLILRIAEYLTLLFLRANN